MPPAPAGSTSRYGPIVTPAARARPRWLPDGGCCPDTPGEIEFGATSSSLSPSAGGHAEVGTLRSGLAGRVVRERGAVRVGHVTAGGDADHPGEGDPPVTVDVANADDVRRVAGIVDLHVVADVVGGVGVALPDDGVAWRAITLDTGLV